MTSFKSAQDVSAEHGILIPFLIADLGIGVVPHIFLNLVKLLNWSSLPVCRALQQR